MYKRNAEFKSGLAAALFYVLLTIKGRLTSASYTWIEIWTSLFWLLCWKLVLIVFNYILNIIEPKICCFNVWRLTFLCENTIWNWFILYTLFCYCLWKSNGLHSRNPVAHFSWCLLTLRCCFWLEYITKYSTDLIWS